MFRVFSSNGRASSISRAAFLALLSITFYWVIEAASEAWYIWPVDGFSFWGLQSALAQTAVWVAGILIGLVLIGRVDKLAIAVTWTFLVGCLIVPVRWYLLKSGQVSETADGQSLLFLSALAPPALVLIWLLRGTGWRKGIGLVPAGSFMGALALSYFYLYQEPLVYTVDTDVSDYVRVDIEALYGAQQRLLDAEIAALAPERPGQPDMYSLLLGGTASQSVFLNEVEAVGPLLEANYGAKDRILRLANNKDHPMRYPLANKPNLEYALAALHDRMGPEDVTFLFLTSHGGKDLFSLSFYEAGTNNMTADEFAAILKRTKTGPAIIVLSACHSGSFLDEIATDDRLIIASAHRDRTSFGCADGRDWTEFGRFFFDQALRKEPDLRLAFANALPSIRWRELITLRRASLPQISEGAEIGPVLERLLIEKRDLAAI